MDTPACQRANVMDPASQINLEWKGIAGRKDGSEEIIINLLTCSLIESFFHSLMVSIILE